MPQTEFTPILQQLDRLEAVLFDSSEIPLSGRGLVHKNEVKQLIDTIRISIPISGDNHQEAEVYADPALSNTSSSMKQPEIEAGSTKLSTYCRIRSRIEAFTSKLNSETKLRRKRQIKILLSDHELYLLDRAVEDTGLDRASVFRHLLLKYTSASTASNQLAENNEAGEPISRINISDMGVKPLKPTIQLLEPRDFDEMPNTVKTIRNGTAVILNLTMMEPDQAQRAVDWVAGATFYADGYQERVGESIFLFSPASFNIVASSDEADKSSQALIKGDSVTDLVSNQVSLTPLQESCLKYVRDRWNNSQSCTTPSELVAELNPSSDSSISFRLIRKTLFQLSKEGLVKRIRDEDECFDYMPVIKVDPTRLTELVTEDA